MSANREPPADLVRDFEDSKLSLSFEYKPHGMCFVFCVQDSEFPLLKQLRFYLVGTESGKPFKITPLPQYRVHAYVKNFLHL